VPLAFGTMQDREAGQTLGGKYRLVRLLGQGGMGSVWHAEHLTLSSPVALKLIDPSTAKDPDTVQRFLREARTAAALRSPHVVQILDYGVDGDTPYIAMELLDGESLAERLTRAGRLSTRETARMIQHVARAIGRAHEAGIVHRDLKPENVFIVKNDDEEVIKVLDFGIVKANPAALGGSAAPASTRTGTLLGTPYYMSPEQAAGEKSVDHRADIWALGVIAFKCLIGHLPFRGDSVGKLILEICSQPLPVPSHIGKVPHGFDTWFARACSRDPAQRFQSAKQAAAEFGRLDENTLAALESPSQAPGENGERGLGATTGHSTNSEIASRSRRAATPRWLLVGVSAAAIVGLALWAALNRDSGPVPDTAAFGTARAPAAPLAQPPSDSVPAEMKPAVQISPTPDRIGSETTPPGEPPSTKLSREQAQQRPAPAATARERKPTSTANKPTKPASTKTAPAPSKVPSKPAIDLGI
jgi:eukaryotic-like serine/threonine-protein kinase